MTIGEFSRLTGLTAKALRHYDAIELLVPAEVDPQTAYRMYSHGQIERARAIRRLKDLGLPSRTCAPSSTTRIGRADAWPRTVAR